MAEHSILHRMEHFDGVGYRQLTDQFVGDLRRCVNKIDNTR
ncbi:hypothetical protein [Thalassoglobus sp.]